MLLEKKPILKRVAILSLSAYGLACSHFSLAADLTVQVVDNKGAPVENAIVFAEPANKALITPPNDKPIEIEQRGREFHPLVSAIQTGSSVLFPNHDSVRHHVYSFSPAKVFELKLYSGVPTNPVLFDKPGTVVLGCNIHDNMLAFVEVVDTPFFAKSDAKGNAVLTNLPNGQYALKSWHYALAKENVVSEQLIVFKGNDTVTVKLELKPFETPIPR